MNTTTARPNWYTATPGPDGTAINIEPAAAIARLEAINPDLLARIKAELLAEALSIELAIATDPADDPVQEPADP